MGSKLRSLTVAGLLVLGLAIGGVHAAHAVTTVYVGPGTCGINVVVSGYVITYYPIQGVWTGFDNTCTLASDLTIPNGDLIFAGTNANIATVGFTIYNYGAFDVAASALTNVAGTIENYGSMTVGVAGTVTSTLSGALDNSGGFVNQGTVSNSASLVSSTAGSFDNQGTIYNVAGGTINIIGGAFDNQGTVDNTLSVLDSETQMDNSGSIDNNAGGVFANAGALDNVGTITNAAGGLAVNYATLDNSGTVSNVGGSLQNNGSGTISNTGTVDNLGGSFKNFAAGALDNQVAGTIDNSGALLVNYGAIDNAGSLENNALGFLENNGSGTISNTGTITNAGESSLENNGGTLNNQATGAIDNYGAFVDNYATFDNSGVIDNSVVGTVVNFSPGSMNNGGTITNEGLATLENNNTLDNQKTGTIENTGTGLTENFGTLTNSGNITAIDTGEFSNYGALTNYGNIDADNPGALSDPLTNQQGGTIENYGLIVIAVTGPLLGGLSNYGAIDNHNSGTVEVTLGDVTNQGTIVNSGFFENTNATFENGLLLGGLTGVFDNFGLLQDNGVTVFQNSGILHLECGSSFEQSAQAAFIAESGSSIIAETCTSTQGGSDITRTTVEGGSASADQSAITGVDVQITGSSALNGTPVTITSSDLGGQPTGTGVLQLAGAGFFDVQVSSSLSLGANAMAQVCITNPGVSGSTDAMEYWNGQTWVSATDIQTSGDTVCGNLPVSVLGGTPIAIGSTSGPTNGVPQFPIQAISPMILVALLFLGVLAIGKRSKARVLQTLTQKHLSHRSQSHAAERVT